MLPPNLETFERCIAAKFSPHLEKNIMPNFRQIFSFHAYRVPFCKAALDNSSEKHIVQRIYICKSIVPSIPRETLV